MDNLFVPGNIGKNVVEKSSGGKSYQNDKIIILILGIS